MIGQLDESLFCQSIRPGARCVFVPGQFCADQPCLNITGEYTDPDEDPQEDLL